MVHRTANSHTREAHGRFRTTARPRALSARQREVLELLAEGVPTRAIAARLGLAEATVRNHIRLVLRKLDCHSQLEAVAVAYRLGLLRRDEPAGSPGRSVDGA